MMVDDVVFCSDQEVSTNSTRMAKLNIAARKKNTICICADLDVFLPGPRWKAIEAVKRSNFTTFFTDLDPHQLGRLGLKENRLTVFMHIALVQPPARAETRSLRPPFAFQFRHVYLYLPHGSAQITEKDFARNRFLEVNCAIIHRYCNENIANGPSCVEKFAVI